jgi:hypothetical protein
MWPRDLWGDDNPYPNQPDWCAYLLWAYPGCRCLEVHGGIQRVQFFECIDICSPNPEGFGTINDVTESLSHVKGLKEWFYAGDLDGKIQAEELG